MKVCPADKKARIVEVGSGSGGTSVVVMAALADLGECVEFVYTDISPQLVAYGRRTYGQQFPFAAFKLLDVEKDTEDQVCYVTRIMSAMLCLLCRHASLQPVLGRKI